jgi:hypothetical protein
MFRTRVPNISVVTGFVPSDPAENEAWPARRHPEKAPGVANTGREVIDCD